MTPESKVYTTKNETVYTLGGKRHREDGPAYVFEHDNGDRYEEWAYNDKIHRYGGPAVQYRSGNMNYFIHDRNVNAEVNEWLEEHGYVWETMSDIEKWELDMFMRTLG